MCHSVAVLVKKIGLLSLLDTWVTPQEQRGGMLHFLSTAFLLWSRRPPGAVVTVT